MYWMLTVLTAVGAGALVVAFTAWKRLDRARVRLSETRQELTRVRTDAVRAEERSAAEMESERARMPDKAELIDQARRRLTDAVTSTSREALDANSRTLLRLAQTKLAEFQSGARADLNTRQHTITELVEPVMRGLAQVGTTLQRLDVDRAAGRAAIEAQLKCMGEHGELLATETRSLVRALRTPTVRGRWGELQLRRVIELAGMTEQLRWRDLHLAADLHKFRTAQQPQHDLHLLLGTPPLRKSLTTFGVTYVRDGK